MTTNNFFKSSRFLKILSSICFCLISVALLIAFESPVKHYEAFIYSSTPLILWFSLLVSFIWGVSIVIYQIASNEFKKSRLYLVGFLLIFLVYTTSLSIHIIRGYYMWCMNGDPASHIGSINQIITEGHVAKDLFYPVLHIFLAEISLLSSISILDAHKLIPLFFGVLYVPFMYLFCKSVLINKKAFLLATIASLTLVMGWYLNLTPNHLSNLLFPLVLFSLIRAFTQKDTRWSIILIILLFLYPPFHPVSSLAFLILLLSLWTPRRALGVKEPHKADKVSDISKFKMSLVILLSVWLITWVSSFYVWNNTIKNIVTLMTEGGTSHISSLIEDINYAEGYGYNVVEQAIKVLFGYIVYILFALISFPIIWKKMLKEKEVKNLFTLYGPIFTIFPIIILLYLANMTFSPLRLLVYLAILCTPFIGFLFKEIIETKKYEHYKLFFLLIASSLLIITFTNELFKLYPSPYILSSSWQTTKTEVYSMDWLFHVRNVKIDITSMTVPIFRMSEFLLNPQEKSEQKIPWTLPKDLTIPYHFGYTNQSSLSERYPKKVYMILNEKDKTIYVDLFPDMAKIRFSLGDFEMLKQDKGLASIYSNGGAEVFYIYGLPASKQP